MEERKRYVPLGSRIFRAIQRIYVGLLILCLAAGLLLFGINAISAKTGAGIRFLTVRTDSMLPEFFEGDLAVVLAKNADKISEGDVIAYRPGEASDAYLIHRVTEKISDYEGTGVTCFCTAGDFADEEDGILVDESHVIGTVVLTVPEIGYLLRFLVMRWYCPVLVTVAAFLVFLAIRLARYWMDHREDDFPDGEEIAAGGFWLKNRNGRGIRIAKWQVAHVLSPLFALAAVAGVLVLWKVSEGEVTATLTRAENGGVVVVEDYAGGSRGGETEERELSGSGTSPENQTTDAGESSEGNENPVFTDSEVISAYQAIAEELEGIRAVNTGNLESLIRAVLTGDGWSFDYEHVATKATGDTETESYITAVWQGKTADDTEKSASDDTEKTAADGTADETMENSADGTVDDAEKDAAGSDAAGTDGSVILRIYLSSVVLSTDKENQDMESRYPSEEDYDMESEEGQEAYEEAWSAALMSLKYNWTFDVGESTSETAYFYYNYSLQPATGTKELIDRVEIVTDDIGEADEMTEDTTGSVACRVENIVISENEELSSADCFREALEGSGWSMVVRYADGGSSGYQISSKMYYRDTWLLEWQTLKEREVDLEEETGYGSMDGTG